MATNARLTGKIVGSGLILAGEQEMPLMPSLFIHLAMFQRASLPACTHLNSSSGFVPVLIARRSGSLRRLRSRLVRVLFSVVLVLPTIASAHDSWISRQKLRDPNSGEWCCNENDCSALDEVRIVETKEGYVVDRRFFISKDRAIPSYDGRYWACFDPGGLHGHGPKRDVRCFFVPMNM